MTDGYHQVGERTCEATVVGGDPQCDGDTCDATRTLPPHATVGACTAMLVSGSECTLACESGWTVRGKRRCDAGNLTDTTRCTGDPCSSARLGPWIPPDHGSQGACSVATGAMESGACCEPRCDGGYSLTGKLCCFHGARQDNSTCLPKPCDGTAGLPLHIQPGNCTSSVPSGHTCSPECDPLSGFYLHGVRTCQAGKFIRDGVCRECTAEKCSSIFGKCEPDDGNHPTAAAPGDYWCKCTDDHHYGSRCQRTDQYCADTTPCKAIDKGSICFPSYANRFGYECNCSAGYNHSEPALAGIVGQDCDAHKQQFTEWEWACIASTAASVLPVFWMVRGFLKSLDKRAARDDDDRDTGKTVDLEYGEDALGLGGLLMFLFGVGDLVLDVLLLTTLWVCGQTVMWACCLVTLIVTAAMTLFLGYKTLTHIVRNWRDDGTESPGAWIQKNKIKSAAVILASCSRVNSMAILRLRIFGYPLLEFPDHTDHLRSCGMLAYTTSGSKTYRTSFSALRRSTAPTSKASRAASRMVTRL